MRNKIIPFKFIKNKRKEETEDHEESKNNGERKILIDKIRRSVPPNGTDFMV
jgi:hypothetical protein